MNVIWSRACLLTVAACLLSCRASAPPPVELPAELRARVAAAPVERRLADGALRLFNVYRVQARVLSDPDGGARADRIERLVAESYRPYAEFWRGYLGDEDEFRKWVPLLVDSSRIVGASLPALAAINIDSLFEHVATWFQRTAGVSPRGTWYLVYGPGWTNMGGLGAIGMVADFSKQGADATEIESVLSHELAHQVHGSRGADPDGETVLGRVIGEGIASYVAWVYHEGRHTPAQSLFFESPEWEWAVQHERELGAAIQPMLGSRARADLDRVANRSVSLLPGAPGGAGYFIGFRIAQAFVARRGPLAWAEMLKLPVAEVLRQSGYQLGATRGM